MCVEEKTILYYPTIKIQDGYWLRNAILYWDKVASIVPGTNYDEVNSVEVEYLRRNGLYEPIYPTEMYAKQEFCNQFCQEIKEKMYQFHAERVRRERYLDNRKSTVHVHSEKKTVNEVRMIHIDKMPPSILDYLLDAGIAQKNCDGSWVDMNSYEAEVYMSMLAKYLAKIHRNTEIGTDIVEKFFLPYVKTKREEYVERQIYADVSMQRILPVPNMDVPLQDIIDFRLEHQEQLHNFRRRIEEFQWDLRHYESIEDIQQRARMFSNEIEDDLREIESLMDWKSYVYSKISWRTLMPVGLSAGLEIGTIYKGMSSIEEGVARLGINFISLLLGKKQYEDEHIRESNAYLFHARKNGFISSSNRKKK